MATSTVAVSRLKALKVALIDLSGTLHIENFAINGAVEALRRLRNAGLAVKFVTNTTKESKRVVFERLLALGFDVSASEIFTSLTAARHTVEKRKLRPLLLLEDAAMEDFDSIATHDPNAVVVGLAPSCFHFEMLNKAFRLVLNGASLIAVHKGRYYKTKNDLNLGPGPFVAALEYATDRTAEVVGKPTSTFFLSGIEELGCKPHEAVMIGDDVRDDVGGAQSVGILGVLVKTGKFRAGDEVKINPPPDVVVDDFPAAVDYILQCRN